MFDIKAAEIALENSKHKFLSLLERGKVSFKEDKDAIEYFNILFYEEMGNMKAQSFFESDFKNK